MSWGNKLIIVFVAFAGLIGTLVYKSMNTKFELVSKDYYKEELRYQEKIDGKTNAAKLSNVAVTQNERQLIVTLPKEMEGFVIEGELWFYCQTDATKDVRIAWNASNSNQQVVSKNNIQKGKYLLKFSWKSGNDHYYVEKEVIVD